MQLLLPTLQAHVVLPLCSGTRFYFVRIIWAFLSPQIKLVLLYKVGLSRLTWLKIHYQLPIQPMALWKEWPSHSSTSSHSPFSSFHNLSPKSVIRNTTTGVFGCHPLYNSIYLMTSTTKGVEVVYSLHERCHGVYNPHDSVMVVVYLPLTIHHTSMNICHAEYTYISTPPSSM